jgi:uncharacterized protein (DUF58 family)
MRGTAPELAEYKLYRQGDEAKRIDWKLLARSDRAYIRLAPERATLATTLLVDSSASMAFPADSYSKWNHARRIAVGLAAVAHAGGDPVGMIIPAEPSNRYLPPRTRRGVVAEIAQLLELVVPSGSRSLASLVGVAYATPRLAIISDFLDDDEGLLRSVRAHIASGGEVHLVHVVAEEELNPPHRALVATDPENPAVRRTFAEPVRAEYQRAFAEWREQLARSALQAGAFYTVASSGEPADRAVRRIVATPGAAVRVAT